MNMKNKIIAGLIAALLLPVCISMLIGIIMLVAKHEWISWIFTTIICVFAACIIYPNVKEIIDNLKKK